MRTNQEIDYRIFGEEMQCVEIELDPQETVMAEAGAFMYKDQAIQMETIFGDGSDSGGGFMSKLLSAGKRVLTGAGLFMTGFTHTGRGKARVDFAAPYPGKIIPLDLQQLGAKIICQKDAFLCAAKGVSIGIQFQKKLGTGMFGGEGFIMEKLEGDGMAFMHAGGHIVERELVADEVIHIDTGCIVAYTKDVDFDIQMIGGIKNTIFGGEGVFYAVLRGPGKVWLQTLPISRFASRIYQYAPQTGTRREEGSVLGGLGNFLDGDGN